jgi:hypothetical protein
MPPTAYLFDARSLTPALGRGGSVVILTSFEPEPRNA